MFYLAYQIHTSNCSGSSTFLKIQAVLAEKVDQKVDVNQDDLLPIYKRMIEYSLLLKFLQEFLMNLTRVLLNHHTCISYKIEKNEQH